jgi:hypothetical protein
VLELAGPAPSALEEEVIELVDPLVIAAAVVGPLEGAPP